MQYSKKVSELARLYNVDPKDVLFSMLTAAGASRAEAFAVIYRPTVSTSNALTTKAANYITQRPGLRKLIKQLEEEAGKGKAAADPTPAPRKPKTPAPEASRPSIDYTDKDAILKELAEIAERCEKESDRLAALREIGALQRMKAEARIDEEKRVIFYLPLSYSKCDELLTKLSQYLEQQKKD